MIPLNHTLTKCTGGYNLPKLREKINHLMHMDDIKLFAENENELETLTQAVRIYGQDIEIEFSMEKCTLLLIRSGKQQMMEGIELQKKKKKKTRTPRENEPYKNLGILEADTIKQTVMKEKKI